MAEINPSPVLFVAATRYAILRPLTGVSEDVACEVLRFAGVVRGDAGVRSAILREIEEARPRLLEPAGFGQTQHERDRVVAAWDAVKDALADD